MRPLSLLSMAALALFCSQCKKVIEKPENSNVYTLASDKTQECLHVFETSDHGVILLSSVENGSPGAKNDLRITKFSSESRQEWQHTIPEAGFNTHVSSIKDGGILVLVSEGSKLIQIGPEGNVVFNKTFSNGLNGALYSMPLKGENGSYYTALNKFAFWLADTSLIYHFDADGNNVPAKNIKVYDRNFGGWLVSNCLYRQTEPETYYMYGLVHFFASAYLDNSHLFVARFEYSGNNIVSESITILDRLNVDNINLAILRHVTTKENELIILLPQESPGRKVKGHLLKVGNDLKLKWEMDIRVGKGNTWPSSIHLCSDGNYLIGGDCSAEGKGLSQPFAAKVSPEGKLIWSKIYEVKLNAKFNALVQHSDGSLYFGGTTNSFGNGLNFNDVFMMKTDIDGNLK